MPLDEVIVSIQMLIVPTSGSLGCAASMFIYAIYTDCGRACLRQILWLQFYVALLYRVLLCGSDGESHVWEGRRIYCASYFSISRLDVVIIR